MKDEIKIGKNFFYKKVEKDIDEGDEVYKIHDQILNSTKINSEAKNINSTEKTDNHTLGDTGSDSSINNKCLKNNTFSYLSYCFVFL